MAASRLGRQIVEVLDAFRRVGAKHALIGGLALAPHKVVRATQDVDLLIAVESGDAIEAELLRLGYRRLHRSADAGNYLRGDERLDLLYASRPTARAMLAAADERETELGIIRVVQLEDLIALKLQGMVNDPRRTQDLEDIRALMRANRSELKLGELREYFRLFERESLLDELLVETR
jgi:predicted nucleotidyltransferase